MINTSEFFTTNNTALVAYLTLEGFSIYKVERDTYPYEFVFKNDNARLTKCIEEYNSGRAIGNIRMYFINYKNVLELIKEGRNG